MDGAKTNPGPLPDRGSNEDILVEAMGLEPTTSCLQSRCSSQLSYAPMERDDRTDRLSRATHTRLTISGSDRGTPQLRSPARYRGDHLGGLRHEEC